MKKIMTVLLISSSLNVYAFAPLPELNFGNDEFNSIPDDFAEILANENVYVKSHAEQVSEETGQPIPVSSTKDVDIFINSSIKDSNAPPSPIITPYFSKERIDALKKDIDREIKSERAAPPKIEVYDPAVLDLYAKANKSSIRVYQRDLNKELDAMLANKPLPFDVIENNSDNESGTINEVSINQDTIYDNKTKEPEIIGGVISNGIEFIYSDLTPDLKNDVAVQAMDFALKFNGNVQTLCARLTTVLRKEFNLVAAVAFEDKCSATSTAKHCIKVVAGTIEKVQLNNRTSLSKEKILNFINLKAGDLINNRAIERPLLLLKEQGFDAKAHFEKGTVEGKAILIVDVTDTNKSFNYGIFVNNAVENSLGKARLNVNFTKFNLSAIDKLLLNLDITDKGKINADSIYSAYLFNNNLQLKLAGFYQRYSLGHYFDNGDTGEMFGFKVGFDVPLVKSVYNSLNLTADIQTGRIHDKDSNGKISTQAVNTTLGINGNSYITDEINVDYKADLNFYGFTEKYKKTFSVNSYVDVAYEYNKETKFGFKNEFQLSSNSLAPAFMFRPGSQMALINRGDFITDSHLISEIYGVFANNKNHVSVSPYFQFLYGGDKGINLTYKVLSAGFRAGFFYKDFKATADVGSKIYANSVSDKADDLNIRFNLLYNY